MPMTVAHARNPPRPSVAPELAPRLAAEVARRAAGRRPGRRLPRPWCRAGRKVTVGEVRWIEPVSLAGPSGPRERQTRVRNSHVAEAAVVRPLTAALAPCRPPRARAGDLAGDRQAGRLRCAGAVVSRLLRRRRQRSAARDIGALVVAGRVGVERAADRVAVDRTLERVGRRPGRSDRRRRPPRRLVERASLGKDRS